MSSNKNVLKNRASAPSAKFRPTPRHFGVASSKCSRATRVTPAPYSLTRQYRGSPCWSAILHVDNAWAGSTCNRCRPMRLDPRPFVPEHEWEWERPQGSHWPKNRAHHAYCLTGGSDVKTRLALNYSPPFFFPDTFREYRTNEWIDVGTAVMSVVVIMVNIKP